MKEQIKAGEPHGDLSWNEESPLLFCWLGLRTGDKALWGTGELMPLHSPTCLPSFSPIFLFPHQGLEENGCSWKCQAGFALQAGKQEGQDGTGWDMMGPEGNGDEQLQVSFCLGRHEGEQRLPRVCPPEMVRTPHGI